MRRTLCLFLGLVLLISAFSACSSGQPKDVDLDDAAAALLKDVSFEDELTQAKTDMALLLYGLTQDEVAQAVVYVGTGAFADEFSLWKATSADAAASIEKKVQARVDALKESYADYKPQEVPKLESPVVITSGNYVALCVSPDAETAEKTLKEFFK